MIHSGKIGPFTLHSIPTGDFRLDGGAMFGVVPKPLWSKKISADELNRIHMGMRCLLIHSEQTGRIYLIDTGLGMKYDEKFKKIYALDDEKDNLLGNLDKLGYSPDDITDVIFTHLHFDHGGGAIKRDEDGGLSLQFQNASHWVTPSHWETVKNPNAREKASFLPDNIEPLKTAPLLKFSDEGMWFEPGLDVLVMNGHTWGQQLPRISWDGKTLVYTADLIPTAAHIPLAWVMGYDMNPLQTLKEKEAFLKEAADENWYLFLEHDAEFEVVQVDFNGKQFEAKGNLTLADI
ncbi:MBL fold metallo-hydrolase [bacterium]|nr:MAG: MBL fold metallo-hydrolase [bacterium]